MTAIAKADVREARQRAGAIRQGIHNYLETLALIQQAWQERDWETLGYDDWEQYVETEFSEARLRLPAEHRQKAVVELRLAGMSQRAIGSTLGINQSTVSRDLSGDADASPDLPAVATGLDGKSYAATQSPRRAKPESAVVEPEPDQPVEDTEPVEVPAPGLRGVGITTEAGGAATPSAGEDFPPSTGGWTRPPRMSDQERREHEESVRRAQDIAAAHRASESIVHDLRVAMVTIVTGCRYGETGLVTKDMISDLRQIIDQLEGEL